MNISVRRMLGTALGVLALLGPLSLEGRAQFNPYANPFVAQRLYQAAVLGQVLRNQAMATAMQNQMLAATAARTQMFVANALQNQMVGAAVRNQAILSTQAALNSPWANGYGIVGNPFVNPVASANLGYGTLLSTPGNAAGYASLVANYGGYGALGGYGGYGLAGGIGFAGGYGGGMGTQWMINPYQGMLEGAASVTRANSQYYQKIQQARLVREDANKSAIQTRRAMIEELEYERAHAPDPEKIRQLAVAQEINRARSAPPLTDVWSARSLNALLQHLIAQQAEGAKGPRVPLSEDILGHINLTPGDSRGNAGLLKDNGRLKWPLALQKEEFKEPREKINNLIRKAYRTMQAGNKPDEATLSDLQASFRQLQEAVAADENLTNDDYIEARRYLNQINHAITALNDRNFANQFNGNWVPHVKGVAELVQFMRDKGLVFAPATQADESAYIALYHALAAFDAGMPRVATSRSTGDNK